MAGASQSGPGAIRVKPGFVEINADRSAEERLELTFTNTADRPIQVGSHIHLPDVNPGLDFDRAAAAGFRLDIAAGTSVRFEPGASRTVSLVTLRGLRSVPGLQLRDPSGRRWPGWTARTIRRSSDRPPVTRSASGTPTCGSKSSRT